MLLKQADAAGGMARGIQDPQAVTAGVDHGTFAQDHIDPELRAALPVACLYHCECVSVSDLVGRQPVGRDGSTARELRNCSDVIEVLMREYDRVDRIGRYVNGVQTRRQGVETGDKAGVDQHGPMKTFEQI